jgi:hypothetical protein
VLPPAFALAEVHRYNGREFKGCAEFAKWPVDKADAVVQIVKAVEASPDVGRLSAALTFFSV